jgi:hypothetical protein
MQINTKKYTLTISEMEREEVATYQRLFPYSIQDILEGLKYLGFQLKSNSYKKRILEMVVDKIGKRVKWLEL